jgi:hypothetical protein
VAGEAAAAAGVAAAGAGQRAGRRMPLLTLE